MANVTDKNPMVLDTAGVVTESPVVIKAIYWTGITTDGDDLIIKDMGGGIVFKAKGLANADVDIYLGGFVAQGLNLDTIDSGVVLIYT